MLVILVFGGRWGATDCAGDIPGEGSESGETTDAVLESEYVLGWGADCSDIGGETVCTAGSEY